jgi:hypothetical protein
VQETTKTIFFKKNSCHLHTAEANLKIVKEKNRNLADIFKSIRDIKSTG